MDLQQQINDVITKVALLEKDANTTTVLFGKIDATIEKLTEFSNNINKLLAVHEERINGLHYINEALDDKIEKIKTDLKTEIITALSPIVNDTTEIKKSQASLSARLTSLESWKWKMVGIGIGVFGAISILDKVVDHIAK